MEREKGKAGLQVRRGISYLVLILLTILCLFFFYVLFINTTRAHVDIQKGFSFLPGKSFGRNLSNLLNNKNLPVVRGVFNSLFIAAASAILTTYFSALTAYAVHVYDFKLKKAAFTFILMIMTIPTQVSALGFVNLMRRMNMLDSFIPLIAPAVAAPVVFFFMIQYMQSSLPLEVVEAARIDRAGEFYTFNTIVMHIMKPALAVQAIFAFVTSWNNYFIPSLIISSSEKKTLPILIAQLRSADFLKFDMGQVYMLIAISIFPVMIVYFCLSKFIVQGVAMGSVKG